MFKNLEEIVLARPPLIEIEELSKMLYTDNIKIICVSHPMK